MRRFYIYKRIFTIVSIDENSTLKSSTYLCIFRVTVLRLLITKGSLEASLEYRARPMIQTWPLLFKMRHYDDKVLKNNYQHRYRPTQNR